MKKRQIKIYEYVLEGDDVKVIRECLNYCYHRLAKHNKTGIKGLITLKEVNQLRRELGISIR